MMEAGTVIIITPLLHDIFIACCRLWSYIKFISTTARVVVLIILLILPVADSSNKIGYWIAVDWMLLLYVKILLRATVTGTTLWYWYYILDS